MNLSNINKVKALGMPFGTANGKLRKSILFHLVQKIELDLCFRCNKIIASIEDFSIEHKIAWMGTNDPVKYFFDIENIAFSHIICNNKAGLKRGSPGHIPPNKRRVKNDAVSWCYK